jgi:polysaccharide export outer membrane protein
LLNDSETIAPFRRSRDFVATGHSTRTILKPVLILMSLLLSGCGVTYSSPSVKQSSDGPPVTVVALTTESVARANTSKYTPRALPEVFYHVAGNGTQRGIGVFPESPYVPDERYIRASLSIPPQVEPGKYRIGVGDVVLLATKGAGSTVEQLSGLLAAQNQRQGYTVRDDGSIAIPEVGQVEVAEMTIQEAEDSVFKKLVENQINPAFSLEVAEFKSKRVAVGGAVGKPTLVPITLNTLNLGEALTSAGGIQLKDKEFATIRLYRSGKLYQIPVKEFFNRADLQKLILVNGDAIYVDTSYNLDRALEFYKQKLDVISLRSKARKDALDALIAEISTQRAALEERRTNFQARVALDAENRDYVYLTGEVKKQSRFPLPYAQQATLADVLYASGGFETTTGNPSEIYVLRATDDASTPGAVTAWHLNAKNVANIVVATKMQMRPNDIVFIEEQPITKWGRSLQQLLPATLSRL